MVSLAESLRKALKVKGEAEVVEIPDGLRIQIVWRDGQAKLDLYDGYGFWRDLHGPKGGLMKKAHKWAREELPKHGIRYLLCVPLDEESAEILLAHGSWVDKDESPFLETLKAHAGWKDYAGLLRWDLDGDN